MAASDLDDIENILNKLPLIIPRGTIDVSEEDHWFRTDTDVYLLRKAPTSAVHEVTGTLNGTTGHVFTQGTDYDVVDTQRTTTPVFTADQSVYTVDIDGFDEGSISITATVNGSSQSLSDPTDYEIVDADGDGTNDSVDISGGDEPDIGTEMTFEFKDGEDDSIDWSAGGDSPDDATYFYVDYRAQSVISRYVGAHDIDVDNIEDDIDEIIRSGQITRADNDDLERIGSLFGSVGKRGGRNETQYRQFLQAIVQAFKGRGTKPGIKKAIAAGIGAEEDQITIIEDTDNTGYEIEIASSVDTDTIGQVVNDMAELADPSGVKLLSNPVFLFDGDEIPITSSEATVTVTTTGLGSGTLTLDGNSNFPSSTKATLTYDSGETWDNSVWA